MYDEAARGSRLGTNFTSASAHPELLTGELALPLRRPPSGAAMYRSVAYDRRRALGGTLAMGVVVMLLLGAVVRSGASPQDAADKQKVARMCMQWHFAASAVVARLMHSTRDSDLARAGDAVFRMRRANRNCDAGWVTLACQDYRSVAAGLPGHATSRDLFPCARLLESETVGQNRGRT